MILKKAILINFRGILGSREIFFSSINCIVGQNDVGKSTILKALDFFLNDLSLTKADYNVNAEDNLISIELFFDCQGKRVFLGEEIETTLEDEEITNDQRFLVLKKVWTVGENNLSKPKLFFLRKKYEGNSDFIIKTETQLITLCRTNNINTSKGNGEEFNNVEKRQKLREYNLTSEVPFSYDFEEIPASGTTKSKLIGDAIRRNLPTFQYFKADTSLSETDSTIQKYFKDLAFKLIQNELNTDDIESDIRQQLGNVLVKITDKINDVVKSNEKVEAKIDFDWSKLITTSFVSMSTGNIIPLNLRGDGFRRITMMAYFEYLAESQKLEDQSIIFGFEEPETFLHPSAQENLFEKMSTLAEKGYQVIISTHSPVIVGSANRKNIIHISKPDDLYTIKQADLDFKKLAIDLGIKPDNTFTPLFSTSKLLFLVEGIDDVNALNYVSEQYKLNGLIEYTFDELNINIIPIGGCSAVKHWINLELFTKLQKPFFIFLDSDKTSPDDISLNERDLLGFGFVHGQDFEITDKRALENYIHPSVLQRLVPDAIVVYSDFDHAKNFCKNYPDSRVRALLGGASVADKHFCSQTFEELRLSYNIDETDEFIKIYQIIVGKL